MMMVLALIPVAQMQKLATIMQQPAVMMDHAQHQGARM